VPDIPARMAELFAADGEFALAHCLKGYFALLSYKQANVPMAVEAANAARRLARTRRSARQAHVAALDAWIAGDLDRALGIWEENPGRAARSTCWRFRLAHFNNFWLGRPDAMRASVERVVATMEPGPRGLRYRAVLPLVRHEECGDYAIAEPAGRAAIEIDPGDVWGTHAVAHHHGNAGSLHRGHRVARGAGAALGWGPTICCIICGGIAPCFIWSAANSTPCSIFTTGASVISRAR